MRPNVRCRCSRTSNSTFRSSFLLQRAKIVIACSGLISVVSSTFWPVTSRTIPAIIPISCSNRLSGIARTLVAMYYSSIFGTRSKKQSIPKSVCLERQSTEQTPWNLAFRPATILSKWSCLLLASRVQFRISCNRIPFS